MVLWYLEEVILLFPGKEGIYCFQGRRGSIVSREGGDLLFPGKEGICCF